MKTSRFAPLSFLLGLASLVLGDPARAEPPRLAHIFQDGLVFQREMPVPVWGWAAPGTEATVEFAGASVTARAGADGRWQATLPPMAASAEGRVLRARIGETVIERKNVRVGEVWIAAGQSNMNHAGPNRSTGLYPHPIVPEGRRIVQIVEFGFGAELEPQSDVSIETPKAWTALEELAPDAMLPLPAYFAHVVAEGVRVPVGVIRVAVSGTNQAAWMDRATLERFAGEDGKGNLYERMLARSNEAFGRQAGAIRSWEQFKAAEAEWRGARRGPWPGRALGGVVFNYPTALYNTRIHPLAPYAVRGVIWHQGEAGPGGPYGERMVAMARQWRSLFGQDFYFLWGTLSRETSSQPPLDPGMNWFYRSSTNEQLRLARALFGDDAKVEFAELYDVGDHDTHFLQKAEAGRRMGLAALSVAYGQRHVFTGPRLSDLKVEGARAIARFTHVGGGLAYRPSLDGISGVIVAAKGGPNRWAAVRVVDAETLEIAHPDGAAIDSLGYAVAANPHETIFNGAGLPASPFRHNVGNIPWSGQPVGARMVALSSDGKAGPRLNLAHVRREGYVFQLLKANAPADSVERCDVFIPGEWSGVEALADDQPLAVSAPAEKDGRRYVTISAPLNRWITVAATGEGAALARIRRF